MCISKHGYYQNMKCNINWNKYRGIIGSNLYWQSMVGDHYVTTYFLKQDDDYCSESPCSFIDDVNFIIIMECI